jgi:methionyl-tRNA synthetase
MSAGLPLPKRVFGHGFLFNKGEKMSKSVGNVLDPLALADAYGVDPLRYFLLREVPFGQDGNYSHEGIVARINADLANDLGNLAQRSLSMIGKNCGGVLPGQGALAAADEALLASVRRLLPVCREAIDRQALHQALAAIFEEVAAANRYFAGEAPWALKKSDPERMATVLAVTADALRRFALLLAPFMPEAMDRLLDLLAVPANRRTFAAFDAPVAAGTALPPPAAVFPRFVEAEATTA